MTRDEAEEYVRQHLEWLTTDVIIVFPFAGARAEKLDLAIATLERPSTPADVERWEAEGGSVPSEDDES